MAARGSGIPLDFTRVRRAPSTIGAHTLLRRALAAGTQRALADALFTAYFLDGRDVGDPDVLAAIAAEHGIDADEAIRLLRDGDELRLTRSEAEAALASGIRAVPFFVFDGRVAVQGAQSVEVLREAIASSVAPPTSSEHQ